jgi:Holliday junction resolvase RusA-like endonuclease
MTDKATKFYWKKNKLWNDLEIYCDIFPLPYARPRVSRKLNGKLYNPRSSYIKQLRALIKQTLEEKYPDFNISEGEIQIEATFYIASPKYITNSKLKSELAGECLLNPITRPDLDNLLKSVLDAMNGLIYKDDSQIAKLTAYKHYSEANDDAKPGIQLIVKYIEQPLKMK